MWSKYCSTVTFHTHVGIEAKSTQKARNPILSYQYIEGQNAHATSKAHKKRTTKTVASNLMLLIWNLVETCNSLRSTTIVKQVLLYSHFSYSYGNRGKKRAESAQPYFELSIPRRAKCSTSSKARKKCTTKTVASNFMLLIWNLVETCNSLRSTTIVKQVLLYSHFLYSCGDRGKKRAFCAQLYFELAIPRRAKCSC